jgi:hypothetical protein
LKADQKLTEIPTFWALPESELLTQLHSSKNGLTQQEAAERLKRYALLMLPLGIILLYILATELVKKWFYRDNEI